MIQDSEIARPIACQAQENNYVECDGLPDAYLQKIGTAMGTSCSVTCGSCATIFMIWLETHIIEEFRAHTLLYKKSF